MNFLLQGIFQRAFVNHLIIWKCLCKKNHEQETNIYNKYFNIYHEISNLEVCWISNTISTYIPVYSHAKHIYVHMFIYFWKKRKCSQQLCSFIIKAFVFFKAQMPRKQTKKLSRLKTSQRFTFHSVKMQDSHWFPLIWSDVRQRTVACCQSWFSSCISSWNPEK